MQPELVHASTMDRAISAIATANMQGCFRVCQNQAKVLRSGGRFHQPTKPPETSWPVSIWIPRMTDSVQEGLCGRLTTQLLVFFLEAKFTQGAPASVQASVLLCCGMLWCDVCALRVPCVRREYVQGSHIYFFENCGASI